MELKETSGKDGKAPEKKGEPNYMNKNIKIKSVKYNFFMNVILKISLFVFPLITFPYVSRILGPEGNGEISFATSVISYATMFASLGIPTYGIRVCAQCRDNKLELSKTVHELTFLSCFTTLFTYVVLILMILKLPQFHAYKTLLLIMSISVWLSSIGMEWFYQAIEQYQYITYRNIMFKILAVVLMFLLVRNKNDVIIYGAITILGTVGSNILNFLRIHKYIYLSPQKNYNIKKHIKPSVNFFFVTVASTIYSNLDTVMVGLIKGNAEVGFYNAGVKVRSLLLSVVNALAIVLLPRISYYLKNNKKEEFKRLIDLSLIAVQFIAIPLTLYFIFEAEDTILLLAGKEYVNAVIPMIIIMPTVIVAGLNNITGIQVLGALELEKYTVLSTVCGAIFDLSLNIILIPLYGASGAAFSTLLTEILVLVIQLLALKKYIQISIFNTNLVKIIISSVGALAVILFLRNFMNSCEILVKLCGTAIIYITIYTIMLSIIRETFFTTYVLPTLQNMKKRILCIIRDKR